MGTGMGFWEPCALDNVEADNDASVRECARPVSPVTMLPAPSSVSHYPLSSSFPERSPLTSPEASIVGRPRHHGYVLLLAPTRSCSAGP